MSSSAHEVRPINELFWLHDCISLVVYLMVVHVFVFQHLYIVTVKLKTSVLQESVMGTEIVNLRHVRGQDIVLQI
jgi:hypothetical protein